MPCNITNNSPYETAGVEKMAHSLYPFAQKRMGFQKPPQIVFDSDPENAQNILGKTAQYEPSSMTITVFVNNRHPKDILRSIAHELVHHTQNCRGEFKKGGTTELGYAQEDGHMREMEREAYEVGNMCFRDWEDGIKSQMPLQETIYKRLIKKGDDHMSTENWKNKELNSLLMEKWGFAPPRAKEVIKEEVDAFMNMKSDYYTGQKEIPKDALEEEEEAELKTNHPQSPGNREAALGDKLDEKLLRQVIRHALQRSLQAD
jgi:hypothetical protein